MIGWDDEGTARAYEAFASAHDRYDAANRALVARAAIEPHHRVLDLASGTGRTAEVVLAELGQEGSVVCVEPAAAMRAAGERRVQDTRMSWVPALELAQGKFDRVVCGAAMWMMRPLPHVIANLAARLRDAGAIAFDVPGLYLGEPDEPGGGDDPHLMRLAAEIAAGRVAKGDPVEPMSRADVVRALEDAGLSVEVSGFRHRLTQAALRDWMKIPVITNALLDDLDQETRDRRIDEAFARCDASAWRWEAWVVFVGRRACVDLQTRHDA